jgi:hypothetical protein
MKKRRTSFWVDPNLILMMNSKGIEVSAFLNRAMILFLELPDDPREALLKKKTEDVVSTLRSTYVRELRESLKTFALQNQEKNQEILRKEAYQEKLFEIGDLLNKTSCFPRIIESLSDRNAEASCWDTAVFEINSKNGTRYEFVELWNLAIDWYLKCFTPGAIK